MRLNATITIKPITRLKTKLKTRTKSKAKTKTKTEAEPETETEQTLQATAIATAIETRRNPTTTAAAAAATTRITTTKGQIECFICNLIQLFILTTTIICTASAIGSGLYQAQAKPSRWSGSSMDTFDDPPTEYYAASSYSSSSSSSSSPTAMLAAVAAAGAAANIESAAVAGAVATVKIPAKAGVTTSSGFQFTTQIAPSPSHNTHMQQQSATTLRVSYDSNEIDNSYDTAAGGAVEAAEAAAAAIDVDIGFDADVESESNADANVDDVEGASDGYVIAIRQEHQNTTNEKNDRKATKGKAAAAAATAAAVGTQATITTNGRQLMNAKTQDLLSLSQLSSYQTSTVRTSIEIAPHEKSASSLKNSISFGNHNANGATFQQIGLQKINGNVAETPTAATTLTNDSLNGSQQVLANGITVVPTLSTSHFRTSAKKVESKFVLPKQQKTDAPMLNYIFDTFSAANKHHHHDQRYGPHFEDVQRVGQATNITVQAGSSIHLNCRISLLQDKTVSWVRRSAQNEENGLDLLTVGLHAYTGDKRYKMEFQYPNNWRLKIINVKKDDEATYECQISTHPPRVIQINLHVNAPKVMIVDEYGDPLQEKYYEIDSTLQLSCVVRNVAMTSSVVFWKHIEDVLNYDVTRGGVSVKTELMDDGANSTLSIAKITKADSGNYTCSISEFQNFTIVVHILNGESFAELHHGGASLTHATWQYIMGLYTLLILLRMLTTFR